MTSEQAARRQAEYACRDAKCWALVTELIGVLEGVIRVADRATDEFDRARESIARARAAREAA